MRCRRSGSSPTSPGFPGSSIKPYDDSQPADVIDDDFLCMQFELTRWLPGYRPPRSEVRVRRLACIVTDDTLPKVGEERGVLAGLVKDGQGIEDASPSLSSASEAMAFLEAGGVDILHFAGHGTFDASQPNESGLPFVDGSVLRPQDLQGRLRTRIGQDRPLVFLNACWSGQQGWSFTRAGGWADRWVRICGCGAFVAPMWPVRDSLALEFAKSFYEALADGATFGQAARQARENVRKLNPGDPSWLAYSVYADVNGRLALGDSPSREDQWQEPGIPDAPLEIRNKIRDFSRLIARKTEGFVGRQWLFDAVDGFVGKQKSGYVLILGDPGIGKSTLIAEMVKRHGHPHHFNVRSEGIRRPEDFLPSVSAQVIAKHGLGYSAIPPDVSRDATFFKAVLERAAAKLLPEQRLFVLVDALDEADPAAVQRGANTLYLPADLPPGVFLVVTSRRGAFQLQISCPEHTIDLKTEKENNFADVKLFAQSWLRREGIRDYIRAQDVGEMTFVEEIVRLSEGNFMYLHYVLPEIETGTYKGRSFDTLPVGLERYYEDQWARMKELDSQGWIEYKLPVLVALTVAKEPISMDLIAEFSHVQDRARIQVALEEWSQFLQPVEAQDDDGRPQKRYRLYHDSFNDFMARKDQVKEKGVDLVAAHRQVADALWRDSVSGGARIELPSP